MKTLIIVALAAATTFTACAETAAPAASQTNAVNKAKRPPRAPAPGPVMRPGTQKGKIVFVNAQEKYRTAAFANIVDWSADALEYNMTMKKHAPFGAWSWNLGKDVMKEYGADLAVIVVDVADLPSLVTVPEEGWAVVNVAKLDAGLKKNALYDKMFESRCDKELFRAFSMIAGGFCSQYNNFALNAKDVMELDLLQNELPFDNIYLYRTYLAKRGITPAEMVPYRQAFFEGWAPKPTNDLQRAYVERLERVKARHEAEDRAEAERAKAAKEAAAQKK